jgi:hypothetical protein
MVVEQAIQQQTTQQQTIQEQTDQEACRFWTNADSDGGTGLTQAPAAGCGGFSAAAQGLKRWRIGSFGAGLVARRASPWQSPA